MKLHRFFIEEKLPDGGVIDVYQKELLHQWYTVLRLRVQNEPVLLCDNSGKEFVGRFISLTSRKATIQIVQAVTGKNIPRHDMTLFQSIVKKENFELIAEKATELGVTALVPLLADRSEKKNIPEERVRKIMKEASEQSGRATLPLLLPIASFVEGLHNHKGQAIALDPTGEKVKSEAPGKIFSLFIGPEGGWSDRELVAFRENNIPVVSMGTQILRAETAAIAALSLFLLG